MLACSTAAGPALEGANIHFGMRGMPGAIDHVSWEDGKLKIHTIGDLPAKGICGSGLIDAAAVLLRIKAVSKDCLIRLVREKEEKKRTAE